MQTSKFENIEIKYTKDLWFLNIKLFHNFNLVFIIFIDFEMFTLKSEELICAKGTFSVSFLSFTE